MDTEHDIVDNGQTLVYIVPTIEDLTKPTVTEIEAGERISQLLTTDGLVGFEPDTGAVDTTSLESKFGTELPGRPVYSGAMLRLKKQSEDDTVYDTLQYGVRTHVVIRRHQDASDPIASDDEVEVYPFACGETRRLTPEADGNSLARYEVPGFLYRSPETRAEVVTAS